VDVKPKTRQLYEGHLRNWVLPHFADVPIASVDKPAIRSFAKSITEGGMSTSTRDGCVKVLRLVLGHAMEKGAIKTNPAWRLKLPSGARPEMHFLTLDQVDYLAREIQRPLALTRFDRYEAVPDYGLLINFAAYTGLRAGEIQALRVKHLNLSTGRVTVADSLAELHDGSLQFSGSTKTDRVRVVRMPKSLTERISAHIVGRPREGLVFPAAEGGPMRHSNFYVRHFLPACQRAGLPDGTRFHDLRHTHVSLLIGLGAHPKAIMERLGHSSITVTLNTYGHLFPELEESLVDGLEGLVQGALQVDDVPARTSASS
jgi:integrase